VVSGALRGNALAAFPEEAFSKDVVIQRFFGASTSCSSGRRRFGTC
jgi:hypothetical protein